MPGECIIIETNRGKDGVLSHLFVVVIQTEKENDRTLLLPLCRIKPNRFHDNTVIINPGEYDFVKEPSYIEYSLARIETQAKLDQLLISRKARRREPKISEALGQRIFDGIKKSPHTQFLVASLYEDHQFRRLANKKAG